MEEVRPFPAISKFSRPRHLLVGPNYDAASEVQLTYKNGGTGNAGDKYAGLDRIGLLVVTIWKDTSEEKFRSEYGRNAVGGVGWSKDEKVHAMSVTTQDNFYAYDGLRQVRRHDRGGLSGSPPYAGVTNLQQKEDFTYDETGNWNGYQSTAPGLVQSRTHNVANQITDYVRQNPWTFFDPLGLRKDKSGFEWKGEGHHRHPVSVVDRAGWGDDAKTMFDANANTISTPKGHGFSWAHHRYNLEYAAETAEFLRKGNQQSR